MCILVLLTSRLTSLCGLLVSLFWHLLLPWCSWCAVDISHHPPIKCLTWSSSLKLSPLGHTFQVWPVPRSYKTITHSFMHIGTVLPTACTSFISQSYLQVCSARYWGGIASSSLSVGSVLVWLVTGHRRRHAISRMATTDRCPSGSWNP